MGLTSLIRSALQTFEDWYTQRQSQIEVHIPALVQSYDPATQKADVQPLIMRRRIDETGEPIDERLPVIPSVPVQFDGSSKFGLIWPLENGDRVLLHCTKDSLDNWLADGNESPGSSLKGFGLADCVAVAGLRDFATPRNPVAAGVMRIGAEDGPQILIDLNTMSITLSAFNEVAILGQSRVRIESGGDIYIQGRWVDPTSDADI